MDGDHNFVNEQKVKENFEENNIGSSCSFKVGSAAVSMQSGERAIRESDIDFFKFTF